MITFRQIEIFLQLAENLHFGKTAQQLQITQAALSKELVKLEKHLNCQLLDRSDKWNITLTAAGEAYYNSIKPLPELMQRAAFSAHRASRGESGKLSISVANIMYDYLQLGKLFRLLHERYPELKLHIRDSQASPDVRKQVESGEVDIGFFAVSNLHNHAGELRQLKLQELSLSFAIPGNHPLAVKPDLTMLDFRNYHFILPSERQAPWLRSYFEQFFMEHCNSKPMVAQEALGLLSTRQLVAAGLGIGLVVEPPEKDPLENVVYRPIPFGLKRQLVAAWHKNNHSRALRNLLKLLPESGCVQSATRR